MKHLIIRISVFFGLLVLSGCYDDTATYELGKVRYAITNEDRAEVLTEDPDDVRTFAVTVYYPSDSKDGPISAAKEKYPVMLFSSGDQGRISNYSNLTEGLAKKGIVVAAIEHPYLNLLVKINGKTYSPVELYKSVRDLDEEDYIQLGYTIIEVGVSDATDTIDLLEEKNASDFDGRLDMDSIAYAGHSAGGAAATLSITNSSEFSDPRIDAAINYDNYSDVYHPDTYLNGLAKPFFYVATDENWGDDRVYPEYDAPQYIYPFFDTAPAGNIVEIDGTGHDSMTDQCGIPILGNLISFGACGDSSKNSDQIHEIFREYTYAFLMKYLKGEPQSLLDGPSENYPEVDMLFVK